MVNNVGTTTETLETTLSATTTFSSTDNITIITGELGLGFLLFDSAGTLGVITTYSDANNFVVKTYALSMDIETILALDY